MMTHSDILMGVAYADFDFEKNKQTKTHTLTHFEKRKDKQKTVLHTQPLTHTSFRHAHVSIDVNA
jgi:hypothetical protein